MCIRDSRRTYHVTPDLRWHGQQLPYSSLLSYVFTDCSTSVDGILPHKLLETILSVSPRIATNWLLSWWCPHGKTKTRSLVHHATSLFQNIINCFPVRGRNLAKIIKQLPWIAIFYFVLKLDCILYFSSPGTRNNYPGCQVLWFRTEIRVNYLFPSTGGRNDVTRGDFCGGYVRV